MSCSSCGSSGSTCSSCGSVILPISSGVVGPQGPQGAQGDPGVDGTIFWYSANTGPSGGNPGDFWVRDDLDELWYNNSGTWQLVWTVSGGATVSGVFTSGSGAPAGTATTGDVYLDITTDTFYKYTGASWVVIPASYSITAWQTPTLLGTYTAGTPTPRFRQRGGIVEFRGRLSNSVPAFLAAQSTLFTLPVGYRPSDEKYQTILDINGGIVGMVKIETGGNVILMGDLIQINNDNLVLDTILFTLS